MSTKLMSIALFLSMAVVVPEASAQGEITVPFSDPARPGTVTASLFGGSIVVTGYEGTTVGVITSSRVNGAGPVPERAEGLRRIASAGGVNLTERNNVITIETNAWSGFDSEMTIRVPRRTALELSTMTGEIRITGVEGGVEVQTMSGSVYLTDVAGPAVVHATNGEVVGTFSRVAGDMPISVSTMNGEIDLTLPSSIEATLAINTAQGDIYSDFDVSLESRSISSPSAVAGPAPRIPTPLHGVIHNSYAIFHGETSQTLFGDINAGGAEIQLSTFNGNIYIRRGN